MVTSDKQIHMYQFFLSGSGVAEVERGEMEESSADESTSCNEASQNSTDLTLSNSASDIATESSDDAASSGSSQSSQDPSQRESKDNREKAGGKSYYCAKCNINIKSWSMFRRHRIRCRMGDTVPPFPTDPITYPNLPVSPELENIYREHWGSIRSHYFHGRIQRMYNLRWNLDSITPDWEEALYLIFRMQRFKFKINLSNSLILQHSKTRVTDFYHSSINNHALFEMPFTIESLQDMDLFIDKIKEIDHFQAALAKRPNTEWDIIDIPSTSVYIWPITPFPLGCPQIDIPQHIKNNHYIYTLTQNRNKTFDDFLCFFRCLALLQPGSNQHNIEMRTKAAFQKYQAANPNMSIPFRGVTVDEMEALEELFQVQIHIFQYENIDEDDDHNDKDDDDDDNDDDDDDDDDDDIPPMFLIRRSEKNFIDCLNILKVKEHFCYLKDVRYAARSFSCQECRTLFVAHHLLMNHKCLGAKGQKEIYPGGVYLPGQTTIEKLVENGLPIQRNFVFPYRITYDFESYFDSTQCEDKGEKTKVLNRHVPLSVSVASNVPGYEAPKCFISTGNPQKLIDEFITHVEEISMQSRDLLRSELDDVFIELEDRVEELSQFDDLADPDIPRQAETHYDHPTHLKNILNSYISTIPLVGFNSGRYDLNCIKPYLFRRLTTPQNPKVINEENTKVEKKKKNKKKNKKKKNKDDDDSSGLYIDYILKCGNNYKAIATNKFIMLDIKHYLAPGYSYAQYLAAYKIEETKGYFPYEYMDGIHRLEETSLPSHESFFSQLKQANITEEEYEYCQSIWQNQNMQSLRDFLIWYNNKDVVPFLEAIDKQSRFYQSLQLDMLKDGIGIPSLTLKYLFSTLPSQTYFSLFSERYSPIHTLFRQNLVGGPSIIYHRFHEAGVTHLRKENGKLVQAILGYDANALYLGCIAGDMPTRTPTIYQAPDFKPRSQNFYTLSHEFLSYMSCEHGVDIISKFTSKERRVGGRLVDGYCPATNTVYQFHGCYFHGHKNCPKLRNHPTQFNDRRKKSFDDLYQDTLDFSKKLREKIGVNLYEEWECEWEMKKKTDPKIQEFLAQHFSHCQKNTFYGLNESRIEHLIRKGTLFGAVLCSIEVPPDDEELRDKFSEFTPIFKNIEVGREHLGPFMYDYCLQNDLLRQPRRTLVGSYKGDNILLSTPLLQWYLEKGLKLKEITLVIQFVPEKCFASFADKVSNARRAGDKDKSQSIISDSMKLIGNSSYGRLITNVAKFSTVDYVNDEKTARESINDSAFKSLKELESDLFEIEKRKKIVTWNLPNHVGFFVYQEAKRRMLSFYYDCIDYYIDRQDFEACQMDTDSFYLALSKPTLEQAVKPELRKEFFENMHVWFPTESCNKHRQLFVNTKLANQQWVPFPCCIEAHAFHIRTPGLFKLEFSGLGIVSLCSKTYFCYSDTTEKISCKGLQKSLNRLTKADFKKVLETRKSGVGQNISFRAKGSGMSTVSQTKAGLSFLYIKRNVLADGCRTAPLEI